MCLLAAFLYVLGTNQGFMDTTQLLLLRMTVISGILLVVSSVFGFFIDLAYLFGKKKIRYLASVFFYCISGIIGGCAALSAFFIIVVSTGNAG